MFLSEHIAIKGKLDSKEFHPYTQTHDQMDNGLKKKSRIRTNFYESKWKGKHNKIQTLKHIENSSTREIYISKYLHLKKKTEKAQRSDL